MNRFFFRSSMILAFSLILLMSCGGNNPSPTTSVPTDSVTAAITPEDPNADILGSYQGVQESYTMKNQYGSDMEVNGNKINVPASKYTFLIKENNVVSLEQINEEDESRVYYNGSFKVLDKLGNTVKIECALSDGAGSSPTYILIIDNSDHTARCIGHNEPSFTLDKKSNNVSEEETTTTTTTSTDNTNTEDAPANYNGVYSYKDDSAELQIVVSGESWTGKTRIITGMGDEYDKVEYESGVVKGNELYESSGYVKFGYIQGNALTTTIGGNSVTLRK